jgi:hypothetical protein
MAEFDFSKCDDEKILSRVDKLLKKYKDTEWNGESMDAKVVYECVTEVTICRSLSVEKKLAPNYIIKL